MSNETCTVVTRRLREVGQAVKSIKSRKITSNVVLILQKPRTMLESSIFFTTTAGNESLTRPSQPTPRERCGGGRRPIFVFGRNHRRRFGPSHRPTLRRGVGVGVNVRGWLGWVQPRGSKCQELQHRVFYAELASTPLRHRVFWSTMLHI